MRKFPDFILICIMLFLLVGCRGEYNAERLYWKAERFSEDVFRNPKGTPTPQYEKAIATFEKVINRYPASIKARQARLKIGQLYMAWEKFPQAIVEFEKILKNYPNEIDLCSTALFQIGNSYQRQGDWKKALVAYQELFNNYKNTSLGLEMPIYIANYYNRNDKKAEAREAFRQAIRDYEKVIKENPKSPIAYIAQDYIGVCYINLEQWREAIKSLEKLMKDYPVNPKTPQSLLTIGAIYQNQLGDSKQAVKVYKEFLKDYPKHNLANFVRKRVEELEKKD